MATRTWWIGAAVAAGLVLFDGFAADGLKLPPVTPFDNTRSGHAEQWFFLHEASASLPPGSTFTIHANDPDTEMSLYMMAVGLMPDSTAVPRRYYGRLTAASASARFVLVFGNQAEPVDARFGSVRLTGGLMTDRGAPRP